MEGTVPVSRRSARGFKEPRRQEIVDVADTARDAVAPVHDLPFRKSCEAEQVSVESHTKFGEHQHVEVERRYGMSILGQGAVVGQ